MHECVPFVGVKQPGRISSFSLPGKTNVFSCRPKTHNSTSTACFNTTLPVARLVVKPMSQSSDHSTILGTQNMKSFAIALVSMFAFATISCGQIADTIYTNGKVYTVNEQQP